MRSPGVIRRVDAAFKSPSTLHNFNRSWLYAAPGLQIVSESRQTSMMVRHATARVAGREDKSAASRILLGSPGQEFSIGESRPYRDSRLTENKEPKRSFTGSSRFCLQPR